MSKMTYNNEFNNIKLTDSVASPHSIDKTQKFEERLKRQRRFSGIFGTVKTDSNMHQAAIDDLETENLPSDDIKTKFKSTKRKSTSCIADITNVSTREVDFIKSNEQILTKDSKIQIICHVHNERKSQIKNDRKLDLRNSDYSKELKSNSKINEKQIVKRRISNTTDKEKGSKENSDKVKNAATNVNYRKHTGFEEDTHYRALKKYIRVKSKNTDTSEEKIMESSEPTLPTPKINPEKNKFESLRKKNVTRQSLNKKDSSTDFSEVPSMNETLRSEHPSTEEFFQTTKPDENIEEFEIMSDKELLFENNNYYEHPDILKYYTDRTIEKFNNLETIFEQPKGEMVMGKRKLKRYLNLEETFSVKKQSKRKMKARKLNPYFRMETLNWNNLTLKENEFFC